MCNDVKTNQTINLSYKYLFGKFSMCREIINQQSHHIQAIESSKWNNLSKNLRSKESEPKINIYQQSQFSFSDLKF